MKERVPWLSWVLELWERLCPFPSCHLSGRSDKSGAAAPSTSTATFRGPSAGQTLGFYRVGFHCVGFGFSHWNFLDMFEMFQCLEKW